MNIRRVPIRRLRTMLRDTEQASGRDSMSARLLRREIDRRRPARKAEIDEVPVALGAQRAAIGARADLQAIIDAWSTLPADVRKMICGVVRLTPKAGERM